MINNIKKIISLFLIIALFATLLLNLNVFGVVEFDGYDFSEWVDYDFDFDSDFEEFEFDEEAFYAELEE